MKGVVSATPHKVIVAKSPTFQLSTHGLKFLLTQSCSQELVDFPQLLHGVRYQILVEDEVEVRMVSLLPRSLYVWPIWTIDH